MIHDVCRQHGLRLGEVAAQDPRFRFRRFVFLSNPASVKATGARYLIFNRDIPMRPVPLDAGCLERLIDLYGPPSELDARVAVWVLK
jgi:hypothetical protein